MNHDIELDGQCSVCGNRYQGFGHNAQPINDGRCCDFCNMLVVMARINNMYQGKPMRQVQATENLDPLIQSYMKGKAN